MAYKFKTFKKTRKIVGTPKVTLFAQGRLAFNKAASEAFNLGKFSHAILAYSEKPQAIGLALTNDAEAEGAMMISHRTRGDSMTTAAFFKAIGLNLKETQRYDIRYDKEYDMLIIDLEAKEDKS